MKSTRRSPTPAESCPWELSPLSVGLPVERSVPSSAENEYLVASPTGRRAYDLGQRGIRAARAQELPMTPNRVQHGQHF